MTRRLLIVLSISAAMAFAADPALLKLLPTDAATVAAIHVEEGKNSPFGQYLLSQWRGDDSGFAKFMSLTGFDPRRDLREVVFASQPNETRHNGVFAAKGSFDIGKFLAAARSEGMQTLVYQGFNVIAGKEGDTRDHGWVALLDGATVLGGNIDAVKAGIARRLSATAVVAPDLQAKFQNLSQRYDAWMYTVAPGKSIPGKLANPQGGPAINGQVLQGVQTASAGVKFGSNVVIDGEAVARSEKDALALQDVIRFLANMVQLNSENAQEIAALLESLQVKTTANLVTVSLQIPESQLEKLLDSRRALAKRPKGRRAVI